MEKQALEFLKSLVALPTPSGWENSGMRLAAEYLAPLADEIKFDLHGNLHVVCNPKAKTRVMVEGHCDEIGFMVQYIDDDGYVYMTPVGGLTIPLLAGERVVIQGVKGPVNGVFGARPPHLMKPDERDKVAPTSIIDIACDIGASSRDEALKLIEIGNPAVGDSGWRELAGARVSCRGFDNRVGTSVVVEAFRQIAKGKPKVAVHLVLTVQEELGLVGATTAAYDIKPDIGICCDVGFASDYPGNDKKLVGDVRLGKGPILCFGPSYNFKLQKHIEKAAKTSKINLQRQVRGREGNTNAYPMRMQAGGAAVALVSIPLRYMHSAVETLSLNDVEQASKVIADAVLSLPATPDFAPDPLKSKTTRAKSGGSSAKR